VSALLLAFLELTFVVVAVMLLHSLRRFIGNPAFYLCLGMFLVLSQIVSSAGLHVVPEIGGLQIAIGPNILLPPFLVALLLVYVIDGTLEAQRLILGWLIILLAYFYLANITANQTLWHGYSSSYPEALPYLKELFVRGRRMAAASFAAHAVDLFVLPIIFQFFRNRNSRLFPAVIGTFLLVQVIDGFVYQIIAETQWQGWWSTLWSTYVVRTVVMVWLSILTTIYLHMMSQQRGNEVRRPFDIVAAFFGGYSHARQLQRNIREWEGRYHVVVENSEDLIFVLDARGAIVNANHAAVQRLGQSEDKLASAPISSVLAEADGETCQWMHLWTQLTEPAPAAADEATVSIQRDWLAHDCNGESIYLDAHISKAQLDERPVAIVIARDVTQRRLMQIQRQELQDQLVHAQRMESIGQLAGGVAHDFNNLLHTIQGSLDAIKREGDANPSGYLSNINEACDRGAALTSQLLGFARKGKYHTELLELGMIMRSAFALFAPVVHNRINVRLVVEPTPMQVVVDRTQLQQVFLNLLLNARDAVVEMNSDNGKIVFRAEVAAEFLPGWQQRPQADSLPANWLCVRVKDTGIGMDAEVLPNIFDPFFTTKKLGQGTGMGLAMVYGCVVNHGGWVHVESTPAKGTEFFLFLPRATVAVPAG